ncbi:hypothetical protein R3W88_022838 [Solanum pinnatisectum]|uniref:Uncharacterized protein n=1 Tax=Solanum pinnatisectum TaxID=50273 RepID=A0AAV9LVR3_9SOLN|nr:hypothetical protein R3W88_022838 [Solanum pinnatisectum]
MWDRTTSGIREEAREVLDVSRGSSRWHRGDKWRNGEVQRKVEAKKVAFTKLVEIKDEEENRTNGAVTTTKTTTFEYMYVELEGKGGDKQLHKLTKGRGQRSRDLDQVKYITDEDGKAWWKKHLLDGGDCHTFINS